MTGPGPAVVLGLPAWAAAYLDPAPVLADDQARMRFVIGLAHENVVRGTGGPFAAAVVAGPTGRVISIGVNAVERLQCSIAHAEVIALALAESQLQRYSLRGPGLPAHELVTTCQPCGMCLGAVGWSGVTRLVYGAAREDAVAIGFDEGLLPEAWARRLAYAGIEVVSEVLRDEARAVLDLYRERGGAVYNP